MSICKCCGQPLPEQVRRDPPLPPLDHPAVITIHDLTPEQRLRAKVKIGTSGQYLLCPDAAA